MYAPLPYDPETYNSTRKEAQPGMLFQGTWGADGRVGLFMYVRAEDADLADGDVVYPADATMTEVTKDISGGSRVGDKAVGVAVGTITDGNYGLVLVRGYHDAVKTDAGDDIAAGNALVGDVNTDGAVDIMAAGEEHQVIAWALADDVNAADTVAAFVNAL